MQAKQNDLTIFVEKDPAAIAVAEGEFIPESLSYRLISYNHYSMKGNLAEKKTTLLDLANLLEPQRTILERIDKTFSSDLFYTFNNFHIRHNNIDQLGTKYKKPVGDLSDEQLEYWYDEVICLANNRADRDTYLILGVRDKTFEIMGVENDPHRRNQQNIVDFLSQKEFAGQIRPRVEVRTIRLEGHEVDVFIIKNSTDVPYYLTESYTDKKYKPDPPKKGKTVQAFHIYTRVMDNNTPIDKSADIRDVEYLWKKRFGLLQTPLEQVKILLRKPDEWAEEDSRYYHKLFPQYTISIEYEEDEDGISKEGNRVFYHHLQTDTRTQYGVLKIYHYSTQLFSCQITELDGHRMTAPCPETKYIPYRNYSDPNICLRYYVTSDFLYLLLRFLEYHIGNANGNEAQYATRRLLDVVLLFDSNEDAEDFATYIHRHLGTFDSKVLEQREPYIANETDMAAKALAQEIRNSQALKEMQPEWELFRLENA